MYAACSDAAGGRIVEVAPGPDLSFPAARVLAALTARTRLVWLTTPNNPTGQVIPREVVIGIAEAAPDALVFVDEAYADFSGVTLVGDPVLDRLPNLVVGRTFAKAHGLAALRAGALVARPSTLAPLRRVVLPYSVNVAAATALPAALRDTGYFDWYLGEVRESKALLYAALDRLGVRFWPSEANFVLARFADAATLAKRLAERGLFVRDRSGEAGCEGCVRMTAGIVADTRALIAALEEVLCGAE